MGLFEKQYNEITTYLASKQNKGIVSEYHHTGDTTWPSEKNRNLVLGQDTAVELGNPKDASTSFLLWVNQPDKIKNGRISIVGPDLPQLRGQQVSFGKIVIIDAADFGGEPGEARIIDKEHLPKTSLSTHSIPLPVFTSILEEDTKAEVFFLGIQAELMKLGEGLTEKVKKTGEEIIEKIKKEFTHA